MRINFKVRIEQVTKSQVGMFEDHLRTGIAHYLPDLFPVNGFETMNLTLGTGCLLIPKFAVNDPFPGIVKKFFAV
jgi:hypothetical protein